MDKNSKLPVPRSLNLIIKEAMIKSALQSADRAEHIGLKKNKIIILHDKQSLISMIMIHYFYDLTHLRG